MKGQGDEDWVPGRSPGEIFKSAFLVPFRGSPGVESIENEPSAPRSSCWWILAGFRCDLHVFWEFENGPSGGVPTRNHEKSSHACDSSGVVLRGIFRLCVRPSGHFPSGQHPHSYCPKGGFVNMKNI